MSSLSPLKPSLSDPADPLLLKGLNPEQREAVLATDGPVLIIAGAGTGKTRVVVHRIAYLLESKPDLKPGNILALAFSRKSAAEMQDRVERLVGTSASELEMATFHGFCHRFLQDHAAEAGLPDRFELLDKVESWIFFRERLQKMKLSHFWNLTSPTDCIAGFLSFISRAKDELVSPDDYAAYVKAIEDPEEQSKAAEAERAYRVYQEELTVADCLDFGDLIVSCYRALQKNAALLQKVRSQYRYILVDEFQDTNVAQIALLKLLTGTEGNLCVVGDDDQAIYRFRGASFASFLLMKEAFPGVRTVRLLRNYRTTKNILSVSGRLIGRNGADRYDPDKVLSTENPAGAPVEILVAHDDLHEAQIVVDSIRRTYTDFPDPQRRYDRFAVFYRAHAHRARLADALTAAGVPFSIHGGVSLFDSPEIEELFSLLKVVQDPSNSVELFRVLSHPLWDIPLDELVALNRAAREQRTGLYDVLGRLDGIAVSEATRGAVVRFVQELSILRKRAIRQPVDGFIPHVAGESPLKVLFRLPLEQPSDDPLTALGRFLKLTYRYAQTHPKRRDLGSFLWYLESYREAGGVGFSEEDEVGRHDGVRLMSIHQAKGLEFDHVFLIAMVQGRFPTRARSETIPFPTELMKEKLPRGDYHLQEERRLCYVACTRAKEKFTAVTRDRSYQRPSVFVKEMLEDPGKKADILRRDISSAGQAPTEGAGQGEILRSGQPASLAAERELLEIVQQIRRLDKEDKGAFEQLTCRMSSVAAGVWGDGSRKHLLGRSLKLPLQEKFSFTQLETFKYCPLKYKFAYVYQIPIQPSPHMTFGVDIHACLEGFFKQVMNGHVPPLQELLGLFERCYVPGRYGDLLQDEEYRRRGVEMLTVFYEQHKGKFPSPIFIEKPFLLPLGDAFIKGVVDRIDALPSGGVEIIDYKTGKPKTDADEGEQMQLRLYAVAAQEILGLKPERISFYYMQTNGKLSFSQKPEVFEATKTKLSGLVADVRTSDFSPDPSPGKCKRCDFRNLCPASMA